MEIHPAAGVIVYALVVAAILYTSLSSPPSLIKHAAALCLMLLVILFSMKYVLSLGAL